ncbi:MAG: hypothetical protein ACRCWA_13180, partial [Clostridium butyricum]
DEQEKHIFSTTDPLGRRVLLKQSTWDEHIKDRHDETGIDIIKKNIENPNCIIENDKTQLEDAKRQCYYSFNTAGTKLYINKTVVEFKNNNVSGEVVTNYILRKLNDSIIEGGVVYDVKSNCSSTRENDL